MPTPKTCILSACLMAILIVCSGPSVTAKTKLSQSPLRQHFEKTTAPEAAWHKYSNAGFEALALGNYKHAEAMFSEGLVVLKQENNDATGQAILHTGLGEALLWQDNVAKAASALNKAYSLGQRQFGEESPEIAEILESLSWLYQAQGKTSKAEDASDEAVAIRRKVMPGSAKLAESLEHRGQLLEADGLYDDAEALYKEALSIRVAASGSESIASANTLEKLGSILQKRGQADDAAKVFNHVLAIKYGSRAPLRPYTTMRTDSRVTFRFLQGSPNCASNFVGDTMAEQIVGNDVTVQARLVKNPGNIGAKTLAEITIYNNSTGNIHILPEPPTMLVLSPKIRIARLVDCERLAENIEKKGESKAKWIRFWGENATTSVTSTIYGNGFPPYGYWSPNFGYNNHPIVYGNRGYNNQPIVYGGRGYNNQSQVYRTGYGVNNRNYNGNQYYNQYSNSNQYYNRNQYYNPYADGYGYFGPSQVITQVPDYQARARAIAKANQASSQAHSRATALRQKQLAASILNPRATLSGGLAFDEKQIDEGILRIPVGNSIFEFIFDKDVSAGAAS